MAYALTKGITSKSNFPYKAIWVSDIDPQRVQLFATEFGARSGDNCQVVEASDIIILAVKPGMVADVLEETKKAWNNGKLLVSIAAGISTTSLEQKLDSQVPVVRVMPNTPCLAGEGVSAISAGQNAGANHVDLVDEILASVGVTVRINESYMDAVTSVSGCGPAYAYLVAEAMIDAGILAGLSSPVARKLVLQTIKGSVAMLEQTGEHPAVLKAEVCSPGGITIAAVRELEQAGLRKAFFDAVDKAREKSIELGQH
jgi:pyrroline-5-carboxylate reductase